VSKKTTKRKMRKETATVLPTATPAVSAASPGRTYEFNPDYSYVIKDLRRIGILAGSFLGVLVILAFILR
jgi:hypothetical protein